MKIADLYNEAMNYVTIIMKRLKNIQKFIGF